MFRFSRIFKILRMFKVSRIFANKESYNLLGFYNLMNCLVHYNHSQITVDRLPFVNLADFDLLGGRSIGAS